MANSIAKLAILLTADPSGLNAGMTRAQSVIRGFNTNISASSAGAGKFFGMFGKATVITAATAVLASFARHGVRAAATMEEFEVKTVRAWQEAQAALGRYDGQFATMTNTLNGRLSRLSDSFNAFAAQATEPLNRLAKNSATMFSKMFDDITEFMGGESGTDYRKRMEKLATETEAAKKHLAELEEHFKKTGDAHDKWVQKMRSAAASVTDSVRTPMEELADKLAELQQLWNQGFITNETFSRASRQAVEDFREAEKSLRKMSELSSKVRAGAAERFTSSGASAVRTDSDTSARLAAAVAEETRVSKEILRVEKEALELAKKRPAVTLIKSKL